MVKNRQSGRARSLSAFERFDALARNVLSVSNKDVRKRMEAENKPPKPRKRKRVAVHAPVV